MILIVDKDAGDAYDDGSGTEDNYYADCDNNNDNDHKDPWWWCDDDDDDNMIKKTMM